MAGVSPAEIEAQIPWFPSEGPRFRPVMRDFLTREIRPGERYHGTMQDCDYFRRTYDTPGHRLVAEAYDLDGKRKDPDWFSIFKVP